MEYMTAADAALKWSISRRSVRQYLDAGRIPGVLRTAGRVLIPADAEKPADRRRTATQAEGAPVLTINPFVFTCAAYRPGHADEYIEGLHEENKKTVARAELAYYRGLAEEAQRLCGTLADAKDTETQLGLFLMNALTSLLTGNMHSVMDSYRLLQSLTGIVDRFPQLKKTAHFFKLYFNIMVHNTKELDFPEVGIDAFAVPPALKPMSVYAYARFLLLEGHLGRGVGLAEGALIFMEPLRPIEAIYLDLAVAVAYISSGVWDKAEYYFRHAWHLAEPDGILAPFAEFRCLLSGLAEKCLRYECPEAYKRISELSTSYLHNWIYVHNLLTGECVTDKLTAIEFNVAMLAARNVSNDAIAEDLNISVNSVRSHMRNIFNKLGIDSRKQLGKYVIK